MPQSAEVPVEPYRRAWSALLAAQVLAMAAVGLYCTGSQRYLYADGSHFFITLLQSRHVMDFDPARQFAHLLMEYPAVFLVRHLNCRDVGLVGFTYGATLFLAPVAGLFLTWWAARKAPAHYWFYPMLSQSIMFLNVSFEPLDIHVATWLFWCLMYLLLFPARLSFGLSALLIGLAVFATCAYETYLFLAWPLVACAWIRGRRAYTERRYCELATCGVCLLLFLISFAVALRSTLVPRDAANRDNFAVSMLLHLVYPPVWYSLMAIACACWSAQGPDGRRGWRVVRAVTFGCGFLVALLPFAGFVVPPLQHISRVQGLYVPLILGGFVLVRFCFLQTTPGISKTRHDELWRLTAWTCVVAVIFQCGATYQWNRYRNLLLGELAQHRGIVAYEDFAMASPIYEELVQNVDYRSAWLSEVAEAPGQSLRRLALSQFNFGFGWALPSLSVALSALNLGTVTTIIEAPDAVWWQPFDPRDPSAIPDLSDFGVSTILESRENSP